MAQPTAATPPPPSSAVKDLNPPTRRHSAFMEVGLVDEATFVAERRNPTPILTPNPSPKRTRPTLKVRFRSQADIFEERKIEDEWEDMEGEEDVYVELSTPLSVGKTYQRVYRLGIFAFVLALLLPILQGNLGSRIPLGVWGSAIPRADVGVVENRLVGRANSPTSYCKRWSHQSELLENGHKKTMLMNHSCRCQRNTLHLRRPRNHRLATDIRHME